jgi:hypothetical protein
MLDYFIILLESICCMDYAVKVVGKKGQKEMPQKQSG